MKELIKQLIKDSQERAITVKPRDIRIPTDTTKIITLIGPRRAGKTSILYHTIEQLRKTLPKENIVYLNFEDERINITKNDLQLIIDAYLELYPDTTLENVHFFFDEIQNVRGWEQFVRRIHDTISKHIYLTGSSAKLLSKEIATALRGRTLTYEVYPLSFKEYLSFMNIDSTDIVSTKKRAKIKRAFQMYLFKGGFPEACELREDLIPKLYQEYMDVMLYRDIAERHTVTNLHALKYVLKKGFASIASEFSLHKTYLELRSQGIKIGKDLLYQFPAFFEDAYILFFLSIANRSLTKQELSVKKVYAIDTGLAHAVRQTENIGQLLENCVFLELLRRGGVVGYAKGKHECDFITKDAAIQVTKILSEKNKKRELAGFTEVKGKKQLLLTMDQEGEEQGVHMLPVWKWLLL
ncbi:MAG: ATP-binding protein [Candidatus Woesearchaeota archaeon]|nr:ATP-binding protein [Candidatus Woesearchaeota archaeon]